MGRKKDQQADQEDDVGPEKMDKMIALMVAGMRPIIAGIFRKYKVSDADVHAIFNAAGDRLIDARALVEGGRLSSGEIVHGIVRTEATFDQILLVLRAVADKVGLDVQSIVHPPEETEIPLDGEEVTP